MQHPTRRKNDTMDRDSWVPLLEWMGMVLGDADDNHTGQTVQPQLAGHTNMAHAEADADDEVAHQEPEALV